jgi:phage recombination protein Bet
MISRPANTSGRLGLLREIEMSEEKQSSLRARFAARYGIAEVEVFDILKATAFKVKDGEATDAQLTALMIVADQYKLNPFTKEIYAYPDKQNGIVPVVSVDGWTRIINEHPAFDGLEFNYPTAMVSGFVGLKKPLHEWTECIIYRKDRSHAIVVREYAEECYREPFTGKSQYGNGGTYTVDGPWQSHPRRMLRHKAQIQCARIAFGFAGIYDEDEAARMIDMGAADEVQGAGHAPDFMPRALPDDPSPTANFTGGTVREAEPIEAGAQASTQSAQATKRERQVDGGADFTAAPNRFDRPDPAAKAQPARKTTAARSTKAATTAATNAPPADAPQTTMFVDEPAAGAMPADAAAASQVIPENMARILGRKMEIAGKTDVDLKARFGVTLATVTKAMFADVQKWVTGE